MERGKRVRNQYPYWLGCWPDGLVRMGRINDAREFSLNRKSRTRVAWTREFAEYPGLYYIKGKNTGESSILFARSSQGWATENIPLTITNRTATSTCRTVPSANGCWTI